MPRLLVTNCTNPPGPGGVYLLDTASGRVRRVHDLASRGLTLGPDGVYVVGNKGAIHHINLDTWRVTQRADLQLDGSHDLKWIDGSFYLVASVGNLVVRLDENLREIDRMQIVEDEGDVCHANCLLGLNGEILLSIFTLSPGRRAEKRKTPAWRTEGKVLRLDWPRKRFDILYEPLSQPHSLVSHNGTLYCCESARAEVVTLDPQSGTKRVVMPRYAYGFARGLEFVGGSAFVGVSRFRKKTTLLHKLRSLLEVQCGVVEFDAKTWKPRRGFRLPGTDTYEILALPDR
jgi:hypothetical protein